MKSSSKKISTLEMEVALMTYIGIRSNLVVPNVSWGMGLHECDILVLTRSNYAREIEIKISASDFKNDLNKSHGHKHPKIKSLVYAVPKKLENFARTHLPTGAGLWVVCRDFTNNEISHRVYVRVKPEINKNCQKWSTIERNELARLGALRILGLKRKVLKLKLL
jgi:hypothetical protein